MKLLAFILLSALSCLAQGASQPYLRIQCDKGSHTLRMSGTGIVTNDFDNIHCETNDELAKPTIPSVLNRQDNIPTFHRGDNLTMRVQLSNNDLIGLRFTAASTCGDSKFESSDSSFADETYTVNFSIPPDADQCQYDVTEYAYTVISNVSYSFGSDISEAKAEISTDSSESSSSLPNPFHFNVAP